MHDNHRLNATEDRKFYVTFKYLYLTCYKLTAFGTLLYLK